jgi:hypothetical protein
MLIAVIDLWTLRTELPQLTRNQEEDAHQICILPRFPTYTSMQPINKSLTSDLQLISVSHSRSERTVFCEI